MPIIHRQKNEPYSAEEMFTLVNDVTSYPKFLPWCKDARVKVISLHIVEASILMAKGPLHKWFTTKNYVTPGKQIELSLIKGPFKHLKGVWNFTDLPQGGSEVECKIDFDFAFGPARIVLTPIFEGIASSLIQAFSERARDIYPPS